MVFSNDNLPCMPCQMRFGTVSGEKKGKWEKPAKDSRGEFDGLSAHSSRSVGLLQSESLLRLDRLFICLLA